MCVCTCANVNKFGNEIFGFVCGCGVLDAAFEV
jgi:hypothetical protein